MIPDYVDNIKDIHGTLSAQALDTQNYWKDSVAERFYKKYIEKYEDKVNLYVNGGTDMTGKGLNDLLIFFDEQERKMAALGGITMSGAYSNKIHKKYHERENWDRYYESNPSELNAHETKEIINKRKQSTTNLNDANLFKEATERMEEKIEIKKKVCPDCHRPLPICWCGREERERELE